MQVNQAGELQKVTAAAKDVIAELFPGGVDDIDTALKETKRIEMALQVIIEKHNVSNPRSIIEAAQLLGTYALHGRR